MITLIFVLAALVSSSLNGSGRNSWSSSQILANDLYALAMFSFPVVGVLIASRHPRNAIGWILLADGLAWALSAVAGNYVE